MKCRHFFYMKRQDHHRAISDPLWSLSYLWKKLPLIGYSLQVVIRIALERYEELRNACPLDMLIDSFTSTNLTRAVMTLDASDTFPAWSDACFQIIIPWLTRTALYIASCSGCVNVFVLSACSCGAPRDRIRR
jgi:hypothetical protein